MMRTILLVAALSASGIALAQEAPPPMTEEPPAPPPSDEPATPPDSTMPDTMPQPPATPAPPAAPSTPVMPPAAASPATPPIPPAGTAVEPGNSNPERDARGIPVISDPAVAPAGANEPANVPPGGTAVPSPNQSAVFAPQPSSTEYKPCSKTVTDHCIQAYEGRRRRR